MTTVEEISYSPVTHGRLGGWINRNGPVICVFAVIFALWEIAVSALSIPDYILPSPLVIAGKIVVSWQLLLWNAFVTFEEILLGFALSVLIAVPLAIAVVYSRIFERVAFPFMVSLQTIPKVALAPILVMWLGYGIMPKIMVAFLISFFPIVINSVIGMRSAEKEMIYLVQSMGASELTTFLKIRLPKALRSIFGGLKVGMGQAVVGQRSENSLRPRVASVICSSSRKFDSTPRFCSLRSSFFRCWACFFSTSSAGSSGLRCRGAASPRK